MEQTSFCVENIQFSVFIHSHSVRKPDTFRIGEQTHTHTPCLNCCSLNNIILKTLNLKKKFFILSNRKREKEIKFIIITLTVIIIIIIIVVTFFCLEIFINVFVNLEPSVSEYYLVKVKKKFTSKQKLDNWKPRFVKSFLVTNLIHHQLFLFLFLGFFCLFVCKPEKEKR